MPEIFTDEILAELHSFVLDDVVTLITVNATAIGGGTHFFAPAPVVSASGDIVAPVWGGNTYKVLPFSQEGFDFTTGGVLPQPIIRFSVARADGETVSEAAYLLALLATMDDMLGAEVLRTQTLRKFLDDGETPDTQSHMGVDVFTVAQKPVEDAETVEFRLRAAVDLEDVKFPRNRSVDYCKARYRTAAPGGGFDYEGVRCPYTDAAMFDDQDVSTAVEAEDICSKSLTGCKARFGANAVLPYYGFAGVSRFARS